MSDTDHLVLALILKNIFLSKKIFVVQFQQEGYDLFIIVLYTYAVQVVN